MITINQNPQLYTPSDNPVTWEFESDNSGNVNFYFLVEVEIGLLSYTVVEKHKIYPEEDNRAKFDVSQITERYANLVNVNRTSFVSDSKNYNRVRIKITEYYGSPVTADATATSSGVYVYKGRLNKKQFNNYNYLDYTLQNTVSGTKYLTNRPKFDITLEENLQIGIINNGDNFGYEVFSYDSSGAALPYAAISGSVATGNIIIYDISPQRLIDDFAFDFTDIAYYTFRSKAGLGGTADTITINMIDSCVYPQAKTISFLNSFGVFDSFSFTLFSKEDYKVKSNSYQKRYGTFNSSGGYDYNPNGMVDYLKSFDKRITIHSDWISAEVQNWLSLELYTSPIIYLDGQRCRVTNRAFEQKVKSNDYLFREIVELELESDLSVNV
jgi:hypothetical protein